MTVIAIFLFDRLWVYDKSQWGTELVEIAVVDAENRRPISGAVLRSSDTEKAPNPKETDINGKAAFAHSYKYEHFTSLLRDRYERMVAHTIEISAPGFRPITVDLESYRLSAQENYSLPHPIIVRLEKLAKDDAAATKASPKNNASNPSGE